MINRTACFGHLLRCLPCRHLLNWHSWRDIIFKWINIDPLHCPLHLPLQTMTATRGSYESQLLWNRLWQLNDNVLTFIYEKVTNLLLNVLKKNIGILCKVVSQRLTQVTHTNINEQNDQRQILHQWWYLEDMWGFEGNHTTRGLTFVWPWGEGNRK